MALTPFRWIAGAIIGMATVFIIAIHERERPARPEDVESQRLMSAAYLVGQQARLQATQFRMVQLIDSTRAQMRRPDTTAIRVQYDRAIPVELRPAFDSALARARERLGGSRTMGIDVSVVYDTARFIRGNARMPSGLVPIFTLPASATGRCAVVIRVGRDPLPELRRTLQTEDAGYQLFGPCAYYAAFGMPGAAIQRWLLDHGALLAYGGSWTRSSEPPMMMRVRGKYFDALHPALYYMTPRGASCVVGDTRACETAATVRAAPSRMVVVGQSVSFRRLGPMFSDYSDFGPRHGEMVAGMVRTLGRERFQEFWRSDAEVSAAFERASGVSLGIWISNWAGEQYGRPRQGPSASAVGLIGAVVLVAIGLFFGLRSAERREFS